MTSRSVDNGVIIVLGERDFQCVERWARGKSIFFLDLVELYDSFQKGESGGRDGGGSGEPVVQCSLAHLTYGTQ